MPSTWSVTKGEGITAMVIDTGHPVHPDIGDNAIEGKTVFREPIEDENGHQLHCTVQKTMKLQKWQELLLRQNCISVKALAKTEVEVIMDWQKHWIMRLK